MKSVFEHRKRYKFEKIEKTAFPNPTFFVFKIRLPLGAMCCHRRKFKKITIEP